MQRSDGKSNESLASKHKATPCTCTHIQTVTAFLDHHMPSLFILLVSVYFQSAPFYTCVFLLPYHQALILQLYSQACEYCDAIDMSVK